MDTSMAALEAAQRERLLKACELSNADAMHWETSRIKVALAAIGFVGGIIAFGFRPEPNSLDVLRAASVVVMFIGIFSFGLVGRYTQSFGEARARAKALYKSWLRNRDEAYARFKEQEKRRPVVAYYFHLLPLSQLVLTGVGIYLFCSTY